MTEPKLDPGAPKPEGTTTKPSIGDPLQVSVTMLERTWISGQVDAAVVNLQKYK